MKIKNFTEMKCDWCGSKTQLHSVEIDRMELNARLCINCLNEQLAEQRVLDVLEGLVPLLESLEGATNEQTSDAITDALMLLEELRSKHKK